MKIRVSIGILSMLALVAHGGGTVMVKEGTGVLLYPTNFIVANGIATTGSVAVVSNQVTAATNRIAILEGRKFTGGGTTGSVTSAASDAKKFLRGDGTWQLGAMDIFSGNGTTGYVQSGAADVGKFLKADGTWTGITSSNGGDFKADGSVSMSSNLNLGANGVTNGFGDFTNLYINGVSLVDLTNGWNLGSAQGAFASNLVAMMTGSTQSWNQARTDTIFLTNWLATTNWNQYATNAGTAGGGYWGMSNGVWTSFAPGSGSGPGGDPASYLMVSNAAMWASNNSGSPVTYPAVSNAAMWASNRAAMVFSGQDTTGSITSAAGDAGKFLKADGTWGAPAGAGDFLANGSVAMTGPFNAGGYAVSNAGSGYFTNVFINGNPVLTNAVGGTGVDVGTSNNAAWSSNSVVGIQSYTNTLTGLTGSWVTASVTGALAGRVVLLEGYSNTVTLATGAWNTAIGGLQTYSNTLAGLTGFWNTARTDATNAYTIATNAQGRVSIVETNSITPGQTNGWIITSHAGFLSDGSLYATAAQGVAATNAQSRVGIVEGGTNAIYINATNAAYAAAKLLTNGYATVGYVDAATNSTMTLALLLTNGYWNYDAGTNWVALNFVTNGGTAGGGYYAVSNRALVSFTPGGAGSWVGTATGPLNMGVNQANLTNTVFSGGSSVKFGGEERTTWFRFYTGDVANVSYPYTLKVNPGLTNDAAWHSVSLISQIPTNATAIMGHGYAVGTAGGYFALQSGSYADGFNIFAGSLQVNSLTHHFSFVMPWGGSTNFRCNVASSVSELYFTISGYEK